MNVEPGVSLESAAVTPQERVVARLFHASELRHAGKSDAVFDDGEELAV